MLSCEFCKIFKNTFLRNTSVRLLLDRIQIQWYFIPFNKSFFYRASRVAASGRLHYFLSLLFLTSSISPLRSSHRKCSIKKAVLKVLNIHRKTPMLESLFNKVQGWRAATLLNGDSNTGIFLWILLFTNSYRITYVFPSVLKFLVTMITKETMLHQ